MLLPFSFVDDSISIDRLVDKSISRIEADGGTVWDKSAFYELANNCRRHWHKYKGVWLPGIASKVDGLGRISKIYNLTPEGALYDVSNPDASKQQQISRADNKGNLVVWSDDLSNSAWELYHMEASDYVTGPHGEIAVKLMSTSGSGNISNGVRRFPYMGRYRVSVWVKAEDGQHADIELRVNSGASSKVTQTVSSEWTQISAELVNDNSDASVLGRPSLKNISPDAENSYIYVGRMWCTELDWDDDYVPTAGAPVYPGLDGMRVVMFDLGLGEGSGYTWLDHRHEESIRKVSIFAVGELSAPIEGRPDNRSFISIRGHNGDSQLNIDYRSGWHTWDQSIVAGAWYDDREIVKASFDPILIGLIYDGETGVVRLRQETIAVRPDARTDIDTPVTHAFLGNRETASIFDGRMGAWAVIHQVSDSSALALESALANLFPTTKGDPDALDYIQRVEAADGQPLEEHIKQAINDFVVGCKADPSPVAGRSNWESLKAGTAFLITGPRTLDGAFVPLFDTLPAVTLYNIVSGDYDRRLGVRTQSATLGKKWADLHIAPTDLPVNDGSAAAYLTEPPDYDDLVADSSAANVLYGMHCGLISGIDERGDHRLYGHWCDGGSAPTITVPPTSDPVRFLGVCRIAENVKQFRALGQTAQHAVLSRTDNRTSDTFKLASRYGGFTGRIAFASVGLAVDLEKLDNRIRQYMEAISDL